MNENSNKRKDSIQLLVAGIVLSLLYQVLKIILKGPMSLDSFYNYSEYQHYLSIFRILATFSGLYLINRHYMNCKDQLTFSSDKFIKVFSVVFLIWFLLIRIYFYKVYIDLPKFLEEIYFNLFVGFWEEYIFRGLILVGFLGLMKKTYAILLSAAYFSLWHWTVVHDGLMQFYFLFNMGVIFGCYFLITKRFLEVCLVHFLWDLIFFGLQTDIYSKGVSFFYNVVLHAGVTFATIVIILKTREKNRLS